MATRRKGGLELDSTVETLKTVPLDARQLVRTKEELLDPDSFIYGYKGMIVACRDEEKLYMLIDNANPTLEASWKDITGGGGSGGPVDWSDVQNKPTFANVATSGSYNDLGDKPTIPEAYDDTEVRGLIAAKANSADLAAVATSGSYNDLGDKPTIPEAYDDTALAARVTAVEDGKANSADLATVATSGSYNDLSDKPTIPAEVTVDAAMDAASENPVQNKVVLAAITDAIDVVETAIADRYTKAETDAKIAEAMVDVDNEHFHPVTVLPDPSVAKENHEYVLITYAQDGTTIESETHYLFYDGVFHEKQTQVSLDGYATEQYVDNAIPTIDSAMSDTSENPVQNKVVLAAIGDAVDVVDTAVQGLDTRVTAVETALNLTALTDEEIAALVPA